MKGSVWMTRPFQCPPCHVVMRASEDWGVRFIMEYAKVQDMRVSGCNFPISQVREGEWTSPRTFLLEGVPIHDFFTKNPAALHEMIVNFQTRHNDVFVVTYPKSGTTWISEILWQVFNDGAESTAMIFDRVSFLERDRVDVTTLPSPRLLHSHLTNDVIPKGKSNDTQCKYIYVARNPKDVAVSFYEFMKDYGSLAGFKGPWEFFARLFAEGKVVYGHWSDHVLGWWSHRDDPNVLFLKYEDLIKDLHSNVCSIAKFLDRQLSEDTIKKISGQCSFNGMKKNMSNYWPERTAEGPKLLRKGKIGDWKNYFTQEQNKKFEIEVTNKLIGTGLEFDFED